MDILSLIEKPLTEYRPMNYWGWLENITPDETSRQVRQMHEAGLGGYVMHARGGLTIPYMGRQWVDSVRAMLETGHELGMLSIVDDEHGWPSGFGAGHVNGKGPDYWVKWLRCRQSPAREIQVTDQTLGVYRIAGGRAERVDAGALPDGDEILAHIFYESDRFYVDNMDPKVVEAFLEYSYEGYRREVGESFGEALYGIFSDEPQLARYATPWSLTLPAEYEKRYGDSLLGGLPALFYEIDGYEGVRYRYWAMVSDLFTQSYARRLCEWCEKEGLVFTGHTTLEENFYYHLQCTGNTMPFYEYMTVPGIDFLTREKVDNLLCLQLTSVTEQLGKSRALSEMYGCAGWNVSLEELKWIGEGHFVLGVNLMLQHLGLYSLRGSRKREYPASLFYQQPWWKDYKPFNDYFARLSRLITESDPLTRTLVIHPIKSAWVTYNGNDPVATDALEATFTSLTDTLLAMNADFHYGDETLLARHGRMEDGALAVGRCRYDTVIVPSCRTLDRATLTLLLDFARENPGRLVAAGEWPTLLEGEAAQELEALRRAAVPAGPSREELESVLAPLTHRYIRVERLDGKPNKWVYCSVRDLDGQRLYYIVNTARDEECTVRLHLSEAVERIDLLRCTKESMDPSRVELAATESLVLIGTGEPAQAIAAPAAEAVRVHRVEGPWAITGGDMNSLTLDRCDYALEDGVWQGEIPVIELQQRLIRRAANGPVTMKFTFRSSFVPEGPLYLVLEDPQQTGIRVNGETVPSDDCGWWIDRSFRKIDISGRVRSGDNEIILTRTFACSDYTYRIKNDPTVHEAESNRVTVETELESVYLLGSFAAHIGGGSEYAPKRALWADGPFTLSPPARSVSSDDLTVQGYPFFAGEILLSSSFELPELRRNERVEVNFGRPDAALCEVIVNGRSARTVMWAPYRTNITALCRPGENTLTLRLVGSCRNLLGPHHNTGGELYGVGPHSYLGHGGDWTDRYSLVRFGLEGGVIVERRG